MNTSLKKCPSCGEWTNWQRDIHASCPICDNPLSPRELNEFEQSKDKKKDSHSMEIRLIPISPNDSALLVFLKRIVQGAQLLFFGIASFVVWLATIIAG